MLWQGFHENTAGDDLQSLTSFFCIIWMRVENWMDFLVFDIKKSFHVKVEWYGEELN